MLEDYEFDSHLEDEEDMIIDPDGTKLSDLHEEDWDLGERLATPGWLELDMAEDRV